MLQKGSNDGPDVSQGCFKSVSGITSFSFKGVSRVTGDQFKSVSRMF